MQPRFLAALALLLLAGCSQGPSGPEAPTTTSTPIPPPPEDDGGVFVVSFEAAGESTLEVPFPTLDSCRAPEHWMAGDIEAVNGTAQLREVTGNRTGEVVAVTGTGRVSWSSRIELGPACQTFRFDPWSTDPDPDGAVVEVRAAGWMPAQASVLVRVVRDHCATATLYRGIPGTNWDSLDGEPVAAPCP